MATAPIPPPKPRLEDPLNEREIFATEVVGVGSVHGNLAITFATLRFDEPTIGETPKARRVVATQLLQSLHKLAAPSEAAQRPSPEPN
jgi:hypothetical protein